MTKEYALREKSGVGAFRWWAVMIAIVGGAAAYYLHISAGVDPANASPVRLVLAVTVVLVGICIVIASSKWWIHR
jgi:hypothetical protein